MKDPWVTCLADNLSDAMVIAATAFGELRHGSVSGTLRFVELARPRWGRAISSLITGVSQLRTGIMQMSTDAAVVNAETGEVAERMDYDAFGRVLSDTNPGFQPFGFAGGLYDDDTGLVRFGARDYDAQSGRWTAKDPVLFRGEDTSLYAYAHGDAVNRIDPWGLYDFSPDETKDILDHAIEEYNRQNTVCALADAAGNNSLFRVGKYDFRFRNRDDTFDVPGVTRLDAAEFGNYFAGYVNYAAFGEFGYYATRAGGSAMETREYGTMGDDPGDIELIRRGAYDAGRGSGAGRANPCACGN